MTGYPRDLVGYADQPPDPRWPAGARLALNFVVNYEERCSSACPRSHRPLSNSLPILAMLNVTGSNKRNYTRVTVELFIEIFLRISPFRLAEGYWYPLEVGSFPMRIFHDF